MASLVTVRFRRFVKDEEWESEDLAGRLGIVAYAASNAAGLVPYGDAPRSGHLLERVDEIGPSAPSLSRRCTAPQLASLEGADVIVLELQGQGDGGVAFQAYLLTLHGYLVVRLCQANLEEATLAPILSGSLADAARVLEPGAAGAWLWKWLADLVFPDFLLELCRRNDLPVTGLESLPDDAVANIFNRLTAGEDLARVECVCRQLRRVVAERDAELWKHMYLSLLPSSDGERYASSDEASGSWKERYVNAWRLPPPPPQQQQQQHRWSWRWRFLHILAESERYGLFIRWEFPPLPTFTEPEENHPLAIPINGLPEPLEMRIFPARDPPAPEPEPELEREVVERRKNTGKQRYNRKLERHHCKTKRRRGGGATHSPSSRYRWTHR